MNVLFKILSSLLSLVLVPVIILTVLLSAVTGIVKPENLVKTVTSVDISSVIDTSDIKNNLETNGIKPEAFDAVLESDTVKDIVGLMAEDVNAVFTGEEIKGFTAEDIKKIVNDNMDEIVTIVEEYNNADLSRDEIEAQVNQIVDENVTTVVENMPKAEEIVESVPEEVLKVIRFINNPKLLSAAYIAVIVLSALIFVLRLKRFAGFITLAVDYIIAGVIIAIMFIGCSFVDAVLAASSASQSVVTVINMLISSMTATFLTAFIILFAVAIAFIVAYNVIKHIRKRVAG